MCGILGGINISIDQLDKMQNALIHRGPDASGRMKEKKVLLGHQRLAIQDIDGGIQPFSLEGYTIVFNGEIYNHIELRENYLKNSNFSSSSDTETLLHLYIHYGNDLFDLIDGMFAFCIYDERQNKLILARDRAGKKPLYYHKNDKKFIFSSELNSLVLGLDKKSIDTDAISFYLRSGFMFDNYTPYKNVKSVKPGFVYELDIEKISFSKTKYFDIEKYFLGNLETSFENRLDEVDSILHKSVKNRLISSDLEVGAFLSGGIDSSLIVAIASQYRKKLKTFTVKILGDFDESRLAKLTSDRYSTDHYEIPISVDVKNDIEKILTRYGQPFMDSSAIPSYYVSREAKKHVTVILNGDGADELFCGYRRYVPEVNAYLKSLKNLTWMKNFLPYPKQKSSLYNYFHRLLHIYGKSGVDYYLSSTTDIFEDYITFQNNRIFSKMEKFIDEVSLPALKKMQYLDFQLILPANLLMKMDISTMTHSLEGRSPFLSRYFLEFAPKLGINDMIKGSQTKYILRELSKKYLDSSITSQPKRGFESPISSWVDKDLKSTVHDYINSKSFSFNFLDRDIVEKIINRKISISSEKRSKIIWTLLTLEIWYEKVYKELN